MNETASFENVSLSKSSNNVSKLQILALHGYRQNGDAFRRKTGSFRKIVQKYAHFTYITAPHKVVAVQNVEEMNDPAVEDKASDEYGWWFNREDKTFRGIRKGGPAIGFEASVRLIEDTFEAHGPFDGLLGFSQGACFVGLLCDLQQRNILKCKFNFAIMVAGFKSNSLPHLKYFREPLTIPSMHIFGKNDQVIPTEMSEELSSAFENEPAIVCHEGGHYLPANAAHKNIYQKFFKCCVLQKEYYEKDEKNTVNIVSNDCN